MNCSVVQSFGIVCEWRTLPITRDALLGVRRSDDFVERLDSSRNALTDWPHEIVAAGVIERRTCGATTHRRHTCEHTHDVVDASSGVARPGR